MPLQRSPSKMAETISSVLDSIQCCTCCVNRFLGEKDPRFYSRLFDVSAVTLGDDMVEPGMKGASKILRRTQPWY